MLRFDHMTVLAPTLEEGIEYLGALLGVEMINAAIHHDMATHNRRVKLGDDCYLEVIARNPDVPSPAFPRWFELDQTEIVRANWDSGFRLRGWVARTDDIETLLSSYEHQFGVKRWLEDDFHFAVPPDGSLPMGGLLPSVIDMADQPSTASGLVDQGVRLKEFVLEHPQPEEISALYRDIGIRNAPEIHKGEQPRYFARLATPEGEKVLR